MLDQIQWKGGGASDYFFWLCDKIGYQEEYDTLLRFLFETEFTWIVPMDQNRCKDGLYLRKDFVREEDVRGDWDGGNPCSVLEMLVALAVRVEEEVIGDPDICLFWRMLDHLGLTETGNTDIWEEIVSMWLNRQICRDGRGGLFPLQGKNITKDSSYPLKAGDQRKLQIWDQCMWWLNENVVW